MTLARISREGELEALQDEAVRDSIAHLGGRPRGAHDFRWRTAVVELCYLLY